MSWLQKHPRFKQAAFGVSCAFVYAGAVNLGWSDILPAMPFLAFVLYISARYRNGYAVLTLLLFSVCLPLYIMKDSQRALFYPAINRVVISNQDTCATIFESPEGRFAVMSELHHGKCDSSGLGGALEWKLVPEGTRLLIIKSLVSHADMGEHYELRVNSDQIESPIYPTNLKFLTWEDGKPVSAKDLRNSIFYYPSLLMYWPILPSLVTSSLSR